MTVRMIKIIVQERNKFHVIENESFSDCLTWDEMLGQIASMTMPMSCEHDPRPYFKMRLRNAPYPSDPYGQEDREKCVYPNLVSPNDESPDGR